MTHKEAMRQTMQADTLRSLGFTQDEAEALRRISMTLHRWFELECGDSNDHASWSIERDDETEIPYMVRHVHTSNKPIKTRIADREAGALRRLRAIIDRRNARVTNPDSKEAELNIHATSAARLAGLVSFYVQGDPRGASLYILRAGDVPDDVFVVEEIAIENAPSKFGVFRKNEPRSAGGKLIPRQTYGSPFDNREDAERFAHSETVSSYYTRGICIC